MAADMRMGETLQKIYTLTEKTLNDLFMKWGKMYELNDDFKKHSCDTFVAHVEELYDSMLVSEETKLIRMTEQVEMKLKEIVQLERELGVVISRVNTELPLQSFIAELNNAMKEYITMKETRLEHFNNLKEKESELCKFLGKEIKSRITEFPKEKDFEEVELYIFEMNQLKIERTEFYNEVKSRISQLYSKLGLEPQTFFEKKFMSINEPELLDDDYLTKIKAMESSLNEKVENLEQSKSHQLEKIKKLWNKLNINEAEQNEFLNSIGDGLTSSVFEKLAEECSRCETLKLENIKPLILSTREKILEMWNKLHYTEEQRKEFCPFYSPFFNEDVLGLLEFQLEKLTAYYNENIAIFELVEKWNNLWERMTYLDELSKDKNRLYNRGGQLLKEEKERKAVENNLPKIYVELERVLIEYEEKSGSPFLWNGENLLVKVQEDWMQRELFLKNKNLNKRGMSPCVSAQKRKLFTTPTSSAKKCKTPLSVNTRSRPITPVSSTSDLSSASIASYSVFQEHIESRYRTPRKEDVNEQPSLICVNTPIAPSHSSPTFTPLRKLRNTPRNAVTPLLD
ncbi:hypothetical protein O3M35_000425 [Rhynocoris fuscipes]|uniref:Protein regulator of cytokinesis 1 n=1 Tax=Rhynocoris fuscipes TaxID=488301 RepID=A0AAW1DRT9_9HEMI